MNLEDRDYKFTDEQVKLLGFSSYEELEKYYDIFYMDMTKGPWTKQECERELEDRGIEQRLDYSRRDRLKASLNDHIGIITDWNDTTWIPSAEEIATEKEALAKILNVYFSFSEKQAEIDIEKSSHHL